jgi:signal transduction histidine kinase
MIQTEADPRLDGIIQDAQEELTALRRELARYRGIFDSARLIVGHEFMKPLTSVNGYLELLEERLTPAVGEKERGYFTKIRDSVGRLEALVESIVQMLRIEQGAGDTQALERIDVRSVIEEVRGRFEEHATLISVHVGAGIPPLLVRRRCLEVVIENLISNAIKHGGARSAVRVAASLVKERRGATKEDLLLVTVEDHGVGIPEDKIEDIFTPFFRLDTGARNEGLGLGLALVKSVITIMKGEIHVRSKPGEGTAVTITVPVTNDTRMLTDTVG